MYSCFIRPGTASPSEDGGEISGEYEGEGHGDRSARGRVHHGRADARTAAMAADATADTAAGMVVAGDTAADATGVEDE